MEKVVIIGSGPSGLTAAIYAARASLEPLVIAGAVPGGQLMTTSDVENFPGFPEGIQGPDLMGAMTKQAERFGTRFIYENVKSVDFKDVNKLVTDSGKEIIAQSVIIATGAEAKWIGIESEQRLRGKGVSACATCDGFFFKNKDIVVVGGGDSAMEEALFLTRFASTVYLVHRRTEFKASKIMVDRVMSHAKIKVLTPYQIEEVEGSDNVTAVKLKNSNSGEMQKINVQGVFVAIGHSPSSKPFSEAGIEVDDRGYIKAIDNVKTNIAGVFVAGDVHDAHYRQAITAAGFGCMAALEVEKYLTNV